jgi:hypothetical protein
MPDGIEDVDNVYYVHRYQPELLELDVEAYDFTLPRYKDIRSLQPLALRIQNEVLAGRNHPGSTPDLDECLVVCYGPFQHGIGLGGDTIEILVAHTPSTLSQEEVLAGLRRCQELEKLRAHKGRYKCSVNVENSLLVTGYDIEPWFENGFSQTLECFIHLLSLPKVSLDELLFLDDSQVKCRGWHDLSEIPDSEKQALLQLHLERYIDAHNDTLYYTYQITLLMREMAKARGLGKYFPPMIILLLALRYAKEGRKLEKGYYLEMGFWVIRSDFNLVKFICKNISEYDFENMAWHFDKQAPGGK